MKNEKEKMSKILTLSDVKRQPSLLTYNLVLLSREKVILRPLKYKDLNNLTIFLKNLSSKTRKFYNFPTFDLKMAKELCNAINKYDKLRFILKTKFSKKIIALFEFSFDMPETDKKRFLKYDIKLNSKNYCRFAPCIADSYQNKKVGSLVFPYIIKIAHKFNRKKIILWGGVLAKNDRAIKFYKNNKFKELGKFKDPNQTNQYSIDMIKLK